MLMRQNVNNKVNKDGSAYTPPMEVPTYITYVRENSTPQGFVTRIFAK